MILQACHAARSDKDYLNNVCRQERLIITQELQDILSPKYLVQEAGSFPHSFIYGSSDLDYFILSAKNSTEDHKVGS